VDHVINGGRRIKSSRWGKGVLKNSRSSSMMSIDEERKGRKEEAKLRHRVSRLITPNSLSQLQILFAIWLVTGSHALTIS
jgi:hypothetical protein